MSNSQALFRSAQLMLLAAVVGVASGVGAAVISVVGLVLAVGRVRQAVAHRRRRRDLDVITRDWDARWASWGGRL